MEQSAWKADSCSASQDPITGPYPEPDESSPYPPILFPKDPF
jgi:hypothetical protein